MDDGEGEAGPHHRLVGVRSTAFDGRDDDDPFGLAEFKKNTPIAHSTTQRVEATQRFNVALERVLAHLVKCVVDVVAFVC